MTAEIQFEDKTVVPFENETVLDALLRIGVQTPFSCKGGSCHTCLSHCISGEVPEKARRSLPERLQQLGYFLPCRCVPTGPMVVQRKQAKDMITRCMRVEVDGHASGTLRLQFETMSVLDYRMGQSLRLVTGAPLDEEPLLILSSDPNNSPMPEARWTLKPGQSVPDFLAEDAEFGLEFDVRGPFNLSFEELPAQTPEPLTDPALWQELDNGKTARKVLDAFYAKVYSDPQLSPFFEGVTQDRAASKQYSFMEQLITGERVFWGDNPRNTHHWMVITHALFDHRQHLMIETLREHGLTQNQIDRWTRFEEHFRQDMVKDKEWPKTVHGEIVSNQGFDEETLSEATLCDQCSAEVPAGTRVLYHKRTGQISCPQCVGGQAPQPS